MRSLFEHVGDNRARNDEVSAFLSELANDLQKWLCYATKVLPPFLRQLMEPQDLLQEAYLTALNNRHFLLGYTPSKFNVGFKRLVFSTVANLARSHRRQKRIINLLASSRIPDPRHDDPGHSVSESVSSAPSPEEQLRMKEEIKRILKAIESLAPEEGILLLLVCLREVPLSEAAKELGVTAQAASARLWRAKRKLKRLLQAGNKN